MFSVFDQKYRESLYYSNFLFGNHGEKYETSASLGVNEKNYERTWVGLWENLYHSKGSYKDFWSYVFPIPPPSPHQKEYRPSIF